MATRTHAREMVVELLYAYAMGNERIFDFADELLNAKKIRNAQADFAKGLFNGVVAHLQNIDSIIEANLKSWELSRLGVIDKCILRLGVYEILKGEIDAPVAINEAIEIAKILGAENTGKFVNGVLDAISKKGLELNSSLGASCGDLANFECSQTPSLVSHSKFAKNSTTSTANTRIVDSNKKDSKQSKKKNNRATARTKSHPIRGAKNRNQTSSSASADFLLESKLRGSPPKSEKRQLLARRGSGVGGAALLREKTSESKKPKSDRFAKSAKSQNSRKDSNGGLPRFAKGKSRNDKSISKPTNLKKSKELK